MQEFLNKLKTLRNRNIDQFRRLSTDKIDQNCLMEIRKILLSDRGQDDLATVQDVISALDELQSFESVPEYDYLTETEQMADNLMEQCIICKTLIINDVICTNCVQLVSV